MNKIPCSVGIITLNSSKTLTRCLESLKDFAEIVICDGNSTDETQEIARKYGCKIIKQYDSDESNISCFTDKANVRNKNMEAASYDWYFFMDSDDELSQEAVKDIRKITENDNSPYKVYRIPMKIFIGEKEIKYSSNYPMYQERLVNRNTGIKFIKPVHERLGFDKNIFEVGEIKGFYNIHWSNKRASSFWRKTILPYVDIEVKGYKKLAIQGYLKWICWYSFKGVVRVILFSLRNYILHGFKNSMPIQIESSRAGYHLMLFWKVSKKQFKYQE